MKHMNVQKKYGCNLQLFTGDGGDGGTGGTGEGAEDGEDPEDDPDEPEDDSDEKKYSQKDLDEAIKKDRRKQQRVAAKKKKDAQQEDNTPPAESEDTKARKAAEDKAADLEVRVACYEAGVAKDAVEDVTALAHAYMAKDEDLDLEDAIEKVVKKYPQFKAGTSKDPYEEEDDKPTGKAWAGRQSGKGTPKLSGVVVVPWCSLV